MRRLLNLILCLSMAFAIQGEVRPESLAKGQAAMGDCCPCDPPPDSPDCCPTPSSPARCPGNSAPLRIPAAIAVAPSIAASEGRTAVRRAPQDWTTRVAYLPSASPRWEPLATPTEAPPPHRRRQAQLGVFRI